MGEDSISGSSTPRFLGLVQSVHYGLLLHFLAGSRTKTIALPAVWAAFKLLNRWISAFFLNPIRGAEGAVVERASSWRSH